MGAKETAMKVLVTGAGGFLGGAIVRALLTRDVEVVALQRGDYPWLVEQGVQVFRGDLSDQKMVSEASEDCDVVFHVAAKAGVWGKYDDYYQSNVVGTDNVVTACQQQGVSRLIYTSSPSVVFSGVDEDGINEQVAYPEDYLAAYPETKAIAERRVLAANGNGLSTIALRPHLIWGVGDQHLAPRIIDRARAGRLRLVGDRNNLVDSTYIDNAVQAHLLALESLAPDATCAGKAYFISNGEPIPMPDLINRILAAANMPPIEKTLSANAAYGIGVTLEFIYRMLSISKEPAMTRFIARQLSCAHWYDLSAARNDLGYEPEVSLDEGFRRLQKSLNK